jgi:hypothetical protein
MKWINGLRLSQQKLAEVLSANSTGRILEPEKYLAYT